MQIAGNDNSVLNLKSPLLLDTSTKKTIKLKVYHILIWMDTISRYQIYIIQWYTYISMHTLWSFKTSLRIFWQSASSSNLQWISLTGLIIFKVCTLTGNGHQQIIGMKEHSYYMGTHIPSIYIYVAMICGLMPRGRRGPGLIRDCRWKRQQQPRQPRNECTRAGGDSDWGGGGGAGGARGRGSMDGWMDGQTWLGLGQFGWSIKRMLRWSLGIDNRTSAWTLFRDKAAAPKIDKERPNRRANLCEEPRIETN